MTEKPKRPKRESEQSRRFIETARRIGVDETDERFEHDFRKIVPPVRPLKKEKESPK